MKEIVWEKYEFEFQQPEEEEYVDEEELELDVPVVMQTPFGLFRVDDTMNPFKRFDFRMGHTNFDITPSIMDEIQTIPGVEVLVVPTRYRFIIATARLFEFKDVRIEIEREICGKHQVMALLDEIKNTDIKEMVTTIHKEVSQKKYWAIYVFPNGAVVHTSNDEKTSEFESTEILYAYASQISEGVLITSENEYK